MLDIGDQAPDFVLLNQDGKPVRLSDFRGKPVVIFTFPKAGTSGCTKQACVMRDTFPMLEQNDAVIIGISADSPEELKAWQQRERLCYDLLSDPNHDVLEKWGVWGMKVLLFNLPMANRTLWVLDADGVVHARYVPVSPQESGQRALEALATLPSQTARK